MSFRNRPIFTKRDWPSFKAAITWNDQIEQDPLLTDSGYYDIIAGTNATGTGAVNPTGATAGNGFAGEPDVLGTPTQTSAEKFAKAYGIDPVRVQAALTPQMGYAEYLKRTGMAGVSQKQYDATVRSAEADYAKGKATYGQKAETLGQRGLTGSGYGDYLTGASFAAMQNAKVAAADTKALTDAETARGYGEYLTGVQQANAQAAAQAANANAVAEAEAKAQNDAAYNSAVSGVKSLINENVANDISDDQIKALVRQQYGDIFDGDLDSWLSSAHTAIDPEIAKANEEKTAADTANIKGMIADYIAQGIDDKGIAYRIQLQYGNAYDGSLSQWINESRTALQGDITTAQNKEANSVYAENVGTHGGTKTRQDMLDAGYTEEQINAAMEKYSKDYLAQWLTDINLKGITLNDIPTNDQIDNEVTLGRLTEADAATLKATAATKRDQLVDKEYDAIATNEDAVAYTKKIYDLYKAGDISREKYAEKVGDLFAENIESIVKDDTVKEPAVEIADIINSIEDNEKLYGDVEDEILTAISNKIEVSVQGQGWDTAGDIGRNAAFNFVPGRNGVADIAKAAANVVDAFTATLVVSVGDKKENINVRLSAPKSAEKFANGKYANAKNGEIVYYDGRIYIKETSGFREIKKVTNMTAGGKDNAKALYDLLIMKYKNS
jgi:hypothetical protein